MAAVFFCVAIALSGVLPLWLDEIIQLRETRNSTPAQLMAANKELVLVAGDLLMKAADFPMADELAQRLRRMVPPQALGVTEMKTLED